MPPFFTGLHPPHSLHSRSFSHAVPNTTRSALRSTADLMLPIVNTDNRQRAAKTWFVFDKNCHALIDAFQAAKGDTPFNDFISGSRRAMEDFIADLGDMAGPDGLLAKCENSLFVPTCNVYECAAEDGSCRTVTDETYRDANDSFKCAKVVTTTRRRLLGFRSLESAPCNAACRKRNRKKSAAKRAAKKKRIADNAAVNAVKNVVVEEAQTAANKLWVKHSWNENKVSGKYKRKIAVKHLVHMLNPSTSTGTCVAPPLPPTPPPASSCPLCSVPARCRVNPTTPGTMADCLNDMKHWMLSFRDVEELATTLGYHVVMPYMLGGFGGRRRAIANKFLACEACLVRNKLAPNQFHLRDEKTYQRACKACREEKQEEESAAARALVGTSRVARFAALRDIRGGSRNGVSGST